MSDENQQPFSTVFANELINIANERLGKGHTPEELAEGMRHAAANFSAYAFFRTAEEETADPNLTVENFVRFFEYYLEIHMPKEAAGGGLAQTIAKAKEEL